jgi:hypothetical protein
VVGGDFNARDDKPQIVDLSSSWTDAYRVLHPSDPGLTCCIDNLTTGLGEPLEERIDYIFVVAKGEKRGQIVSARHVFDQPFPIGSGWQ